MNAYPSYIIRTRQRTHIISTQKHMYSDNITHANTTFIISKARSRLSCLKCISAHSQCTVAKSFTFL